MERMYQDIRNGDRSKFEAMDYWHNQQIGRLMNRARSMAWAKMDQRPHVQEVVNAQRNAQLNRAKKQRETSLINEVQPLLNFQPK